MSSNSKAFTIMSLESGMQYPDLDSTPNEPFLIEMIGIQPEYFELLSSKFEVDLEDLQDLLDIDERPRIQVEDKFTMVVLRVPVDLNQEVRDHSTTPIGMFTNGRDIIIMQHESVPLKKKRLRHLIRKSTQASEIIYNQWEIVIHSFETVLDIIETTIKETEHAVKRDLYPRLMDKFFQLSRDAIFVDAALKGNMRVLKGMLQMKRFGKMLLDEDKLKEIEVDLMQQIELSQIYRELIDNAMEIYDSIVGHNLNTVMKTLTAVSLLVSVPTLVASVYGMNVGLPLMNAPEAFILVLSASVALTIPFYLYLRVRNLI